MTLSQVYKEELTLGLEPYKLPILFTGGIIIAKIKFSNNFIKYYGGKIVPFTTELEAGDVYGNSNSLRINQGKHIQVSLPYFPNSYQLEFLSSEWLRGRQFNLVVWEHT